MYTTYILYTWLQSFDFKYFWILIGSAQETPTTLSSRQQGVNGSSSNQPTQRLSERPTNEWTTNDVKNLVETALAPRLEAKLRQKRREDRERLDSILQTSSLITDLHSSPSSFLPGRIEWTPVLDLEFQFTKTFLNQNTFQESDLMNEMWKRQYLTYFLLVEKTMY